MTTTSNAMKAGTAVKINHLDAEYTGRTGEICLTEPFTRISPYSGSAYQVWRVRFTDGGRFDGRSFEFNSECIEVIG